MYSRKNAAMPRKAGRISCVRRGAPVGREEKEEPVAVVEVVVGGWSGR